MLRKLARFNTETAAPAVGTLPGVRDPYRGAFFFANGYNVGIVHARVNV